MIGEHPDLEKSVRMLNRVIERIRDGITIEADQRHVRDILKGLELDRSNRSAQPCAVDRRDECKGESRHGQGQTQIEHEWDNANNSDNRDRPQMADDDDPDSQALTNGDITQYRALVARISYLSQDRPDLKFASMQVCCAMAKPTMRDMERVKRIGRYLVGFRWQQSGELEAYSDADWGGDKATEDPYRPESSFGEATASKCGPRSSKWWRCLQLRASCTPRSKLRQKGWGSRASQKTWEYRVG